MVFGSFLSKRVGRPNCSYTFLQTGGPPALSRAHTTLGHIRHGGCKKVTESYPRPSSLESTYYVCIPGRTGIRDEPNEHTVAGSADRRKGRRQTRADLGAESIS